MADSFVVHAEYIEDLPEEYKRDFLFHTYNYGIFGIIPELTGLEKSLWVKIQRRIDTDRLNYEIEVLKNRIGAINQRIKAKKNSEKDLQNKNVYGKRLDELYEKLNSLFSYDVKNTYDTKNTKNNEKLQKVSYDTPTPDIESDIDSEFDSELESEFVPVSEAEPAQPAENSLSPSSQEYSNLVFEVFQQAGLPCRNGNPLTFLQTDFKFAMEYIHNSPKLRTFNSKDIIAACKNYASVINDSKCYYKNKMNFDRFVRNGKFEDFLPDNFVPGNFIRYEYEHMKNEGASPPEEKQSAFEKCPKCRAKRLYWVNEKERYQCDSCKAVLSYEEVHRE